MVNIKEDANLFQYAKIAFFLKKKDKHRKKPKKLFIITHYWGLHLSQKPRTFAAEFRNFV